MSKMAFLNFLDRAAQDEAMQSELAGIAKGRPAAIPPESLARFDSEKGFSVTAEDVRSHTLDLADADLDLVAGGLGTGKPALPGMVGHRDWINLAPLQVLLGDRRMM
jgi:hypothetical protein